MIKGDGRALSRSLSLALLVMTCGLPVLVKAAEPPHPPILSRPQVVPYNLNERSRFRFIVHYHSPDRNPPKVIQVVVDGQEVALSPKGGGRNRSNTLYWSRPMKFEPGPHKYHFYCEDSKGMSDRSPRYGDWTGPYVARSWRKCYNSYPELSGGRVVQGEVGDVESYFTFSVHYSDYDSTTSGRVSVVIDGIKHPMQLHKGTLRRGLYVYNTYLDTGMHGYYFIAEDGDGATVTYPAEGFLRGPAVGDVPNTNPELTDPRVEPAIGTMGDVYTFRVRYTDYEHDPPSVIRVFINGTPHDMTRWIGAPYDGVYVFRTKLPLGNFNSFYFRAEDGRGGETTTPIQGTVHGPVVVSY